MPNIQIIGGADNCAYDIFEMSEKDYKDIFPAERQDIEFIDDFIARTGGGRSHEILQE